MKDRAKCGHLHEFSLLRSRIQKKVSRKKLSVSIKSCFGKSRNCSKDSLIKECRVVLTRVDELNSPKSVGEHTVLNQRNITSVNLSRHLGYTHSSNMFNKECRVLLPRLDVTVSCELNVQENSQERKLTILKKMKSCSSDINHNYILEENFVKYEIEEKRLMEFKCKICPKKFRFQHHLNCHIISQHATNIQQSGINDFDQGFEPYASLILDNQTFKPSECKGNTQNSGSHKEYQKFPILNSRTSTYCCEKCGQNYKSFKTLQEHKHTRCGTIKSFKSDCYNEIFHYKKDSKEKDYSSTSGSTSSYQYNKYGRRYQPLRTFSKYKHSKCGTVELFECDICGRSFSVERHLRIHILQNHSESTQPSYECNEYKIKYKNSVEHEAYKFTEYGTIELYRCDSCDRGLFYKPDWRKHILKEHSEITQSTSIYYCNDCGKSYKSLRGLQGHKLTKCGTIKPFKCDSCDQEFSLRGEKRKHTLKEHSTITQSTCIYKCNDCSKGYKSSCGLQRHKLTKCGTIEPFKYDFCGQEFSYRGDKRKHTLRQYSAIPQPTRIYQLNNCKQSYKSLRRLQRHKLTKCGTIKPFKCDFCDKIFSYKGDKRKHMLKEHSINTNSTLYQCNKCGKCYKSSLGLRGHNYTMCGTIKPFECIYCGKLFSFKGYLRVHILQNHLYVLNR